MRSRSMLLTLCGAIALWAPTGAVAQPVDVTGRILARTGPGEVFLGVTHVRVNYAGDAVLGGPDADGYAFYFVPRDSHDRILIARGGGSGSGPNVFASMMPRQAPTLDESGNVTLQLTVDGVEAMYRWERSSDTLTRVLAEGEACPGDLGDTVTDMEPPPTPGNYLGRVDLVSNRGDVFTTYTCAAAGEQWGRLDAGALALRPLFAEGTTIAGPSGETMELRHRDLYGPMVTAPNGDLWMFAIGYCPSDAMCLPGGGTSLYGLLHYDAAASRWEMAPWASDPSFCADTGPMENMRQPVTLSVSEESELAFFAYVQDGTSTGPPGIFVRRLGATHLVAREIAPTDYALGHADDLIFNGGSLHLLPGGEALFNIPGAAGTGISSTWVTASRDSGLTAVLGPDSEVDLTPLETLTVRIVEQFVVGRDGDTYAKALLSDIRERTILRGRTVVARDGDTMVDELDGSRVELGEADLMDLTYGGGNQTEGASRGDSITVAGNGSDGRPYVVTERAVLARTAGGVVVLLNGDPRPDPSGMSTNMGDAAVTLTAVVEDAAIRWTVVVQNVGDEPATIEAVRLSGASGGATLAIQPPLPSDCVETAAPVGVPWEVVCATPFALDPGATRTFEILTDRDPDGSAVVAEAAIEVTNDPFTMDNVATATASRSGADLRLEVVVPGEDPDIGTSPYLRLLNAYNDGPDTAVYVVVHAELRTTLSGAELWLGDGTSGTGTCGPAAVLTDEGGGVTLHTLECVLGIIPPFSTERAVLHGSADYDGRVWVTSETEDPSLANNEATVHVADERSPATGACSAAPGRRGGSALWIVAVACAGAGAARRRRRAA